MWTTILNKLQTTLEGITQVKEVIPYPIQGNPSKYPAVVFYPVSMVSNDFNSTKDNFKIYTVNISVILSIGGTTVKKIYTETMPKIADKVVQELDEAWNFGTIDGHRCWARASTGEITYTQEQAGGFATQNILLEVKVLTDI